jgi:glycosyltransferase involved in cell wall biosynthesis
MPLEVSIVVPTHNRATLLRRTLSSLAQLDVPADSGVELVVVASSCSDDTLEVVRQGICRFPYAVRAVAESAPGVACARNRGLAEARSDLIAFVDDDVWVERNWLNALVKAARTPGAGILVGRVTLEWEASRPTWTSPAVESLWGSNDYGWDARELRTASPLRGANFVVRRAVVDTVGGFLPVLGRHGKSLLSGEETDFGSRALEAGFRLQFVPQMTVRHWIPRERATRGYLKEVAIGRGRSRIVLQQSGHGRSASDCIRLGTAQAAIGATRAVRGWLRRDDAGRFAATLLYHRGIATLAAFMQARLRRKGLVGH